MDNQYHKSDSQGQRTGDELRQAREAAGLTRPKAAELFHVNAHSLYRWEAGLRRVGADDFKRLMAGYASYTGSAARQGANVPRGTSCGGLPDRFAAPLERFERELIRMGAEDAEVDLVRDVFRSPEAGRFFQAAAATGGGDERVDAELELLFEAARLWVRLRIERRVGAAGHPTMSGAPRADDRDPLPKRRRGRA